MRAKEILNNYNNLKIDLKTLRNQRADIVNEEAQPSAIDYSADRVQTSPQDGMFSKFSRIQKRTIEIDEQILLTEHQIQLIDEAMDAMQNKTQKRLLYLRYVKRKEWTPISLDIGYSEVHTKGYLHGNALKAFEQNYRGA